MSRQKTSACTTSTNQPGKQSTAPKLVEVDILLPKVISLNEESILKVHYSVLYNKTNKFSKYFFLKKIL